MNKLLKRLAIASLLGFPIALIASRLGMISLNVGMLVVALSVVLALLVFIVGAFLSIKQKGSSPQGAKNAFIAMLISLVPIVGVGSIIVGARDIPRIHNISTDVVDPPAFNKVHEIRTSEHNPLGYEVDTIATIQQAAYPNVKTLSVAMSRQQAHQRTISVIDELGWHLVHHDQAMGVIEASHTTRLWGFTDDVVIRLRANQADDQVAIDLRSVSRIGQSDLGANAKRIEEFLTTF